MSAPKLHPSSTITASSATLGTHEERRKRNGLGPHSCESLWSPERINKNKKCLLRLDTESIPAKLRIPSEKEEKEEEKQLHTKY